ncbi:MAG TPA: L-threonine 3-dehydrogenase [Mycobacteriales bacterium]|jgi:threonine 3-dehydrogenase|nr:L-threonine 3-dehydrogenase [Mycobacteriales bacterium]
MKALVKAAPEKGLVWSDVPEPEIGRDDVLIKVLRTGICGTDLHIYEWDPWAQGHVAPPLVVGHEFVGEIAAVGDDVHELVVGDLVSGEGHLTCGRCRNCMAGRRAECARTKGVGVNRPGCFAEFIALPATNVWRHHDDIDLDVAAIFDPFGNAVHTALTFPIIGEDVLITGAGPIGLMAAIVARHAGARHIVATDVADYRLELARRLGVVSRAVDVRSETLPDAMAALGMTEGFDVGFEMSGHAEALRSMLATMRHGGSVAMLGLPTQDFAIDWGHLVLNMITIRGIYGRQMFETWYEMSVLIQSGVDITPVITHRYDAAEWESAFDVVRHGECGKVILTWADR